MQYLDASEYAAFGLGDDTNADLVTAASALIDSFCRRPSLGITQYVERHRLSRSYRVQLSHAPLASFDGTASPLVQVRARTARSRNNEGFFPYANDASAFLHGGEWIVIDVSTIDVADDGVLSIQPNFLGAAYLEAEVTYTAGFAAMPVPVKVACAQIVRNAQATPSLNVRRQSMDNMQMEYFSSTLLDADVQRLLQPYRSQRVG